MNLENTNNVAFWKKIKESNPNKKLHFIHTPKCGGTYVRQICKKLNIIHKNKGHQHLTQKSPHITFTVIRDPVKRFESLLNYRLSIKIRDNWPNHLRDVYDYPKIGLNTIVRHMSDKDITGFHPYHTLCYWGNHVNIFITIDKLHEFLTFFGYDYNPQEFVTKKVSQKTRGTFNNQTIARVSRIFQKDIAFYKKKTGEKENL